MNLTTVICNIVLFGFVCYAIVDKYPNPKEDGITAFTVLMMLTPILNLVILLFNIPGNG